MTPWGLKCWVILVVGCSVVSATRVIQSMSRDLSYDENNRLSKYALVYDGTSPTCRSMDSTIRRLLAPTLIHERYDLAALEGNALSYVFDSYPPVDPADSCRLACVERGVERSLAGKVMPNMVFDTASSPEPSALADWFTNACTAVEMCLFSYHSRDHPIDVYWKSTTTGEYVMHLEEVKYGESHTRCFNSYLGHEFMAKDSVTGNVIGTLTVEHTTTKAWGESPPSDVRADAYSFEQEIEGTLRHEWERHNRVTRTFSPLGFKKGRLPPDVFASMGAFYYNNAQNVVREEWKNKGVFVNWWETDVMFLQIPWNLKNIYQGRLRVMVEEWAGVPVEQTVMYGLRQYTEGARLLTHVDRTLTHAVSVIVNVAQGNMTEPWTVEVQDHADRLHEVIMDPGDVVYYESAKCLHARNRPMMGPNAYYTNLFTHYRPIDGDNHDQWFSQPNPEGTPKAVVGTTPVEEECKLVEKGHTATGPTGHSLGVVHAVECSNPDLGPYISPSLFQAHNGEDLIRWWRMTSPPTTSATNEAASSANDEL
eukprot:Nitzschia sp. Nitz4//scaffold44_size153857//28716//30425//NITZ4_002702-RA/size153857-snap-gene-0.202-mRNA-1//-1//CDS//3329552100//3629//frame0